eukprot:549825-Rhodomonas_salina.2
MLGSYYPLAMIINFLSRPLSRSLLPSLALSLSHTHIHSLACSRSLAAPFDLLSFAASDFSLSSLLANPPPDAGCISSAVRACDAVSRAREARGG